MRGKNGTPRTPRRLREQLGFDARDWARVLGINVRTVERWEDEAVHPAGLAAEVFRGIERALDAGVPANEVRAALSLGLASFLHSGLLHQVSTTTKGTRR